MFFPGTGSESRKKEEADIIQSAPIHTTMSGFGYPHDHVDVGSAYPLHLIPL